MVVFDFFDREKIIKALSDLYNIDIETIRNIDNSFFETDNLTYDFVKTFGIDLENTSVEDVFLRCKHITTTIDDFNSLKKFGIQPLNSLLEIQHSAIFQFLHNHGIKFNLLERYFIYKGIKIYLIKPDEKCIECFYNGECRYTENIFGEAPSNYALNDLCEYRDSIRQLVTTLYYDNGEIEVHLSGNNLYNYSCVKECPEFIFLIDKLISDLFDDNSTILADWIKATNNQFHCLSFNQNIFSFHTLAEKPYYHNEWYNDFFEFCDENISCLDDLNGNFFANTFLIENSIATLLNQNNSHYGQLKQSVSIPFSNIEIHSYFR